VAGAEQNLVAANANIGVSVANFLPKLGLTTFLGHASPELSAFTGGAGNAWDIGATLAGPLFQGGLLRAQYRQSKAKFEEAKANYQQTVLSALQDVANALVTRQKLGEVRASEEQAAKSLTAAAELSSQRYVNGRASYYEVLQAEQQLYPTLRAKVQAQVGEMTAVVQLYKALGGGWTPETKGTNANRN
jgi:multidrug efflux system outer membrane protein